VKKNRRKDLILKNISMSAEYVNGSYHDAFNAKIYKATETLKMPF
jgi:hypothetical protein